MNAVGSAVCADKTLEAQTVKSLEYEDCQWIFEGGMPMPDYGVTVFQDGSWHSGVKPYRTEYKANGQDMQSLFDYLIENGLVEK